MDFQYQSLSNCWLKSVQLNEVFGRYPMEPLGNVPESTWQLNWIVIKWVGKCNHWEKVKFPVWKLPLFHVQIFPLFSPLKIKTLLSFNYFLLSASFPSRSGNAQECLLSTNTMLTVEERRKSVSKVRRCHSIRRRRKYQVEKKSREKLSSKMKNSVSSRQ